MLLEREHELDVLDRALAAASQGDGRLIVIDGPSGLGKTCLVEAVAEAAERAGLRTLRARGSELEQGFAFGCVRQLLEPEVRSDEPEFSRRFTGAAAPARMLFEPPVDGVSPPFSGDRIFPILRSLYWLCADLAEERPLLLSLDDAHWADAPSLRFLAFLAVRLDGLAALLVVATRSGERGERSEQIARLAQDPRAETLSPRPLSEGAAATLATRVLSAAPDPAFARACHQATKGNPLYLTALLKQAREGGIEPTADAAPRVAHLGPTAVFRAALLHLASLPRAAPALVRAVAILGDGAALEEAAALAGVAARDAATAADALVRRSVLDHRTGLSFAHPVVREAIYSEIPPRERQALHARGAEVLQASGASAERVAAQLLRSPPGASSTTVEILRSAAGAALARGAPDVAAGHLVRALAEPPAPQERADLLHRLGSARFHAGSSAAVENLQDALALATPGCQSALIARSLCQALVPLERNEEAVAALEAAIAGLGGQERELALQLEADMASAGRLHPATYPRTRRRISRYAGRIRGGTPAERALLANLAMEHMLWGACAAEAAELAARSLTGGLLAEQTSGSPAFYDAPYVLIVTGRLDLAAHVCEEALADARARGSQFGFGLVSCFRSDLEYRRGEIAEAEADARAAIEAADEAGWRFADFALAFLIDALIELDHLDEADAMLESRGHHRFIPHTFMHDQLLWSRARLRLAQGRREDALADLGELSRRERGWRARCPAALPYRSTAAVALAGMGQHALPRRLAAGELCLSRRFGAPPAIGIALRACGLAEGGERGIALLRESVTVLERSPA
ncbi:MAG TPA: AAA family ATPase, partial [Solirubrobacteraceae bacterium]|nr:AAA family ATPase [Solirubrobacteraceae bacterium]